MNKLHHQVLNYLSKTCSRKKCPSHSAELFACVAFFTLDCVVEDVEEILLIGSVITDQVVLVVGLSELSLILWLSFFICNKVTSWINESLKALRGIYSNILQCWHKQHCFIASKKKVVAARRINDDCTGMLLRGCLWWRWSFLVISSTLRTQSFLSSVKHIALHTRLELLWSESADIFTFLSDRGRGGSLSCLLWYAVQGTSSIIKLP